MTWILACTRMEFRSMVSGFEPDRLGGQVKNLSLQRYGGTKMTWIPACARMEFRSMVSGFEPDRLGGQVKNLSLQRYGGTKREFCH